MEIRPARPDEAAMLTDLAIRSKAAWGYGSDMVAAFRDELTLDAADIAAHHVFVAQRGDALTGVYALSIRPGGAVGEIALMFVDPSHLRQGIGRALWHHLVETTRRLGLSKIVIDSDPFAEPFYLAMGARRVGEAPSASIPGRMLPRLEIDLIPTVIDHNR